MIIDYEQRKRLNKALKETFILIDKKQTENKVTIKLIGKTGNIYTITLNEDSTLECDCPDSHFCRQQQIACKHLCFIHNKIAMIWSNYFYHNLALRDRDRLKLIKKIRNYQISTELQHKYQELLKLQDETGPRPETNIIITNLFSTENIRNIDDECPVCCQSLENDIVKCPDCLNGIHTRCAELWLKRRKTCVYCRSDVWDIFDQRKPAIKRKYINISNS